MGKAIQGRMSVPAKHGTTIATLMRPTTLCIMVAGGRLGSVGHFTSASDPEKKRQRTRE